MLSKHKMWDEIFRERHKILYFPGNGAELAANEGGFAAFRQGQKHHIGLRYPF